MAGRAVGLAVALGEDGTVSPEHVLLALLWDPISASSQILWKLGVARERVVDRLRDLGVRVPAAPLPAQFDVDLGEQVWFDRDQTRTVLDHLRLHLPAGTQWGFNYDGDRAFAFTESSVDLEGLVAEALPPAVELRRIDHVQLAMPAGREEDATAFYEGLLGLTRVAKPEALAGNGGCWFERGEVKVHLGVDPDFRAARKAHPALLVRGLATLAGRLRDAGVPVADGQPLEGETRVYVDDPFGNRIELVERSGTLLGPP
jgi:catechol 2,3-dioxygenase-like lactoylglutathione lyase family enzyme